LSGRHRSCGRRYAKPMPAAEGGRGGAGGENHTGGAPRAGALGGRLGGEGRRENGGIARRKRGGGDVVSGSGERASQVVLGVGMVAWKLRAGQTKYGFHLRRGGAVTEQFFGDPQVGDAPIGVRKALRNVQAVQPSLLDDGGLVSREGRGDVVRGWHRVTALRIRRWKPRGDRSGARHAVGCSRHQGSAVRRQAHGGMPALHPRRGSIGRAPLGFLMGESGQPSQMAPVGAGRVALVPAGQLSSDCGCQLRWQRLRTHPNPNLQVAGAGLDHGARCMAVGAMTSRTVGAARSRSTRM
jgi:hypothetical protein